MGFKDDLVWSIALIALTLFYASYAGNTLHLGYGYLIGTPIIMLIPGLVLRARALFLTGTTVAVIVSLMAYMAIVSSLGREGGLFGLGHLFSAPGMFLGASVAAWLLRGRINASLPWIVAGFAFLCAGLGFMVGQMIVCTTVLYCGALSLGVWR